MPPPPPPPAARTTAVGFEIAVDEPRGFVARTWTRSVRPWSAERTPYVRPRAPVSVQPEPAASHWSQLYWKFGAPVQLPASAVSVSPTVAVPEIEGSFVF